MGARLDWTAPQYCKHCGRKMRRSHTNAEEGEEDTVAHNSNGVCGMCVYRIKHGIALHLRVGGGKIRTQFTDTEQQCVWCSQWKTLDSFRASPTMASGRLSVCKFCDMLYQHNLSYNSFLETMTEQNNCCRICNRTFEVESDGNRQWCIDHDHTCCPGALSCGRCIRGLLCRKCNGLLGFAKDDVEILQRAINYLIDEKETP